MLFENVIVGADGSPEANQALTVARRLVAEDGRLSAITVAETHLAGEASRDPQDWAARIRAEAAEAAAEAEEILKGDERASVRVVEGRAAADLVALAERERADLLAVGSHGGSRTAGLVFGSVATRVIHDAKCSVLVARAGVADGFPRGITVGIDGSDAAAQAARVAAGLAEALGVGLHRLENEDSPVDALVGASANCDLVVVGNRGESGFKLLGSVAEAVAHKARCAVLIVRG